MPTEPPTAEYFDNWYANKAETPTVAEIMNRHLAFPPGIRAGVITAAAIPELITELRLTAGSRLLDLACGRGGYGLLIARETGATVVGVDFSAQALAEAREQAARLGVPDSDFRVGDLTDSGLPAASVDAVLCTDSIQFPADPADAYREIFRVLRPGGRVALTCWEAADRDDQRVPPRLRRVALAADLDQAGFTDIVVHDRPDWLAAEHAMWQEAAGLDAGDDPALQSFKAEAQRSVDAPTVLRRVMGVATKPVGRSARC